MFLQCMYASDLEAWEFPGDIGGPGAHNNDHLSQDLPVSFGGCVAYTNLVRVWQ